MKKFIQDFKAFITRGNVLDMAVGVIVGGAFNNVVLVLNKQVLMPIVNWGLSKISGLEYGLYTILPNSKLADATTENAILGPDGLSYSVLNYISWSAFIEAIFNFLFISLTLFIIVKIVVMLSNKRKKLEEKLKKLKESEKVQEKVEEVKEAIEKVVPEDIIILKEIRDLLANKSGTLDK